MPTSERRVLAEIRDVCKYFGRLKALDGVSLDIYDGEKMVIIGPSGSGKSTLLRSINRLETIQGGHIFIDGVDVQDEGTDINKIREEIGMVFQCFNVFPHKTVLENVNLAQMVVRKRSRNEASAISRELLAKVGILEKADEHPHKLSGGQQQRVAIARALANDPAIILADEPTGNLDTQTGREVMALLGQLNREEGRTIVIVTHDPAISAYATRTIHLLDGKIVNGAGGTEKERENVSTGSIFRGG